jgi:hypothetical protein
MTMATDDNDNEERRRNRTLNQAENFKVLKLIEAHGTIEDGYYVYESGWSDAKIAMDVGCTEKSVEYRRKEVFGNIRPGRSGSTPEIKELSARIETLAVAQQAARVKDYELQRRIETLEKAINLLLQAPAKEHMQNGMKEQLQALQAHYAKPGDKAQRPGSDFNS